MRLCSYVAETSKTSVLIYQKEWGVFTYWKSNNLMVKNDSHLKVNSSAKCIGVCSL